MEQFAVSVKNLLTNKVRTVKITCMDHYEAHKQVCDDINLFREEIICIKDSNKNEVYNPDVGFIFES